MSYEAVYTCDQSLGVRVQLGLAERRMDSRQNVPQVATVMLRGGEKTSNGIQSGVLRVSWDLVRHVQKVDRKLCLLGCLPCTEFGR